MMAQQWGRLRLSKLRSLIQCLKARPKRLSTPPIATHTCVMARGGQPLDRIMLFDSHFVFCLSANKCRTISALVNRSEAPTSRAVTLRPHSIALVLCGIDDAYAGRCPLASGLAWKPWNADSKCAKSVCSRKAVDKVMGSLASRGDGCARYQAHRVVFLPQGLLKDVHEHNTLSLARM